MFVVWEDGGIKVPYTPGSIRGRRVEKVQRSSPIQKTESRLQDSKIQSPETEASRAAETYQQSEPSRDSRQPAILAKQIMSAPVVTLSPTAKLSDAWNIIQGQRFRHVPVLSSQGHLVGILSDRDLFRATIEIDASSEQPGVNAHNGPIQQLMTRNVLSAGPETEIRAIASILFEERIGAMPIVTETGNVIGILTRSDILRTVINKAPIELWI
ncbi:CBS domain-containing protein [Candidatus Nitrospira salsa]